MIYVAATSKKPIEIGHQGDNNVTTVKFDVKEIIDKFGAGSFDLLYQRRKDKAAVPQNVTVDGDFVLWVIESANTVDSGIGKAQLRFTSEDGQLYTTVYETNVLQSLTEYPIPERPWSSWVDDVLSAKKTADNFASNVDELTKQLNRLRLASLNINKVAEYLYTIDYTDWDYENGNKYFERNAPELGACSAVRKGNLYGRNFDWYYDESATFVVNSKATKGRHASVAVAGGSQYLTKENVESEEWGVMYDVLPFITLDGVNDAGVVCNTNVVPSGDKGITTGTNPSSSVSMYVPIIVRYVLDYADSAADAIDKIREVNWVASSFGDRSLELHFMIADDDSTYIVEFVDNEIKVFSDVEDEYPDIKNAPIMTNFYMDGWDGNIVTGFFSESGIEPEDTTLTPHAEGTERYEIIQNMYDGISEKEDMIDVMDAVKYTRAFTEETEPFWYSELVGESEEFGNLTIYQNRAAFYEVKSYMINEFEHRTRNHKTWHTVHSTVYDIENKTLTVIPQETVVQYEFSLST